MKETENYGLVLPEKDDFYNIDDFNGNTIKIDAKLKEADDKVKNISIGIDNKPAFDYLTVGTRGKGEIGENSFSSGTDNIASGLNSYAEGNSNIASGINSHAEGLGSIAHCSNPGQIYEIKSFDNYAKTIKVNKTDDLMVNDVISIVIDGPFTTPALKTGIKITNIDTINKVITLETTETIDNTWLYVVKLSNHEYPTHAEGRYAVSLGADSHAEGNRTKSIGTQSHAEGDNTVAYGYSSHAEGHNSKSVGDSSHAEGYNTVAVGANSHAEGEGTLASHRSHAEGVNSFAVPGTLYTVLSFDNSKRTLTLDKVDGLSVGNKVNVFINITGVEQGYDITITAINNNTITVDTTRTINDKWTHLVLPNSSVCPAHTEGMWTKAVGDNSHAEGSETIASNVCSHAEGYQTNASGVCSHAEGRNTQAIGGNSHAEGYGCKATGNDSHAGGYMSDANASESFAHGLFVTANGPQQTVLGRYNIPINDSLLIIGNGTSDSARSNALMINNDFIGGSAVCSIRGVSSPVGNVEGGYIKIGRAVTISIKLTLTQSVSAQATLIQGMPTAMLVTPLVGLVNGATSIHEVFMYNNSTNITSAISYSSGQVILISGSYVSSSIV